MLRFIAMRAIRAPKNVRGTFSTQVKRYIQRRSRVVELLLQLENTTNHAKECGGSTQAHVFVNKILVVCVI